MKSKTAHDYPSRYIMGVGWMCTAMGLLIMGGWYAESYRLTAFTTTHTPMAFNAALGLACCGYALVCYITERRRWLTAASLAAVALGLHCLVEYTTGWHTGFDTFAVVPFSPVSERDPGHMTLPAAVCLVLAGSAILILNRPHTSRLRQLLPSNLSWMAIALGTISILSYASKLDMEFGEDLNLRMSLPAAIGFILLGSGINVAAIHNYPFNEIRIKHLRNSVVINTTAGVLILILVSAVVGVWPLYARLKHSEQRELQHAARYKAGEASQFVMLAHNLARQVASRTHARDLLDQYNRGTLEQPVFATESSRILNDALVQAPLLKGITRLDNKGQLAVRVGTAIPQAFWLDKGRSLPQVELSHPYRIEEQNCLIARSPITAPDGTRVGTDLLMVSIRPLAKILNNASESKRFMQFHLACYAHGSFEIFGQGPDSWQGLQPVSLVGRDRIYAEIATRISQKEHEGLVSPDLSDDQMVHSAFHTVGHTEWLIIATANIHDLYHGLEQHLLFSLGAVFLLSLFGAGGMLMLVRPMTSGIIVQAEEMEDKVDRAKASLERELVARKTEQQATREIAEDFRRALNEAPLPIMIYTEDGEVLMVNRAWTDSSGYTLHDIPSMDRWREKAMDRFSAADAASRDPNTDTLTKEDIGPITDGERVIQAKSGARLDWHFRTAPLRSRSVGRLKYVSMAVDITARKAAEAELNRFFTLSLEMLCIFGFDGFFKRVNPAFTEVLGFPEPVLLETPMIDFVHPEDREATRQELERLVRGEATVNFENRYRNRHGGYRWLRWSAHPLEDDQVIYAAARDITESREAAEKIQRTLEALEHSNEELEKFAYVASHDLQEPLRTVGSFTQLLERNYKGRLDAEADEYLEFIRNGAQRAQFLINDLLEFSRVGTRRKDFAPVDCNRLLETLRENMHIAIEECQAELIVEELPMVMGDALQLNQVFQNLISNALKFRKESPPPRIHIAARRERLEWIFVVRDNGIGMEEEYFERIFTIFQRLHGEQYPGTGLGLAICKKVIEQHGGKLWLESKINQGSTFYFSLPFFNLPSGKPAGT